MIVYISNTIIRCSTSKSSNTFI